MTRFFSSRPVSLPWILLGILLLSGHSHVRKAHGYVYSMVVFHGGPSPRFNIPYKPAGWEESWPLGKPLSVRITDNPLWEEHGTDVTKLAAALDEALAAWSNIETADIDWKQVETRTNAPTIWVTPSEHHTTAFLTFKGPVDPIDSCEVFLRANVGTWPAERLQYVLVHEFGHCLGLNHTPVFTPRAGSAPRAPSWRTDPVMSYGHTPDGTVTLDDRIGASLLRPRPGWLETTGSIRGYVVLDDGAAAGFVAVVVSKLDVDGFVAGSVGVVADERGEFEIRGLEPGQYTLLVRPLLSVSAYPPPLFSDFNQSFRTAFGASPVGVRAGSSAGPVGLSVRGGDSQDSP